MDISPYPKILVLKTEMIDAQLGDLHLQTNQLRLDLHSSIVLSFIRDSGVLTKLLDVGQGYSANGMPDVNPVS